MLGCETHACKFVVALVLAVWFAALVGACRLWRRWVDPLGVQSSRWVEEVVVGKRGVPGTGSGDWGVGEVVRVVVGGVGRVFGTGAAKERVAPIRDAEKLL